jgi:phosphotriesterase-related protein
MNGETASNAKVQTVLGSVAADDLGVTLPHEHFYTSTVGPNYSPLEGVDPQHPSQIPITLETRGWIEYHWQENLHNLTLDDEPTAIAEAVRYRLSGGTTVVDVTPIGIGRDPRALASLAERAGLHIVMGTAYYVATAHPEGVRAMSQNDITELIVDEFTHGADGTRIKPGVIGEVGCSWPLLDEERKVLRASAAAQRELAAALYVHPGRHPDAPTEILNILEKDGADMSRVIMCHIERTVQDDAALLELLHAGCFIEYDLFGLETTGSYYIALGITMPSDSQRIHQIMRLAEKGHAERILMSQDICFKHRLAKYGGGGYDHILNNVVPLMSAHGFTQSDMDQLMISNPRRALAG